MKQSFQRTMAIPKPVRLALARLRKRLPCTYPVVVAMVKIPAADNVLGYADFDDGKFLILLDDSMVDGTWHLHMLKECLAHEWAHCLVWDVPNEPDHGPVWGSAYAKCYCAVFKTR